MNREERRNLEKQGMSKETIDKMELLDKPCTIGEVIQLARAAAEDVCGAAIDNYRRDSSSLLMAMTIQIDLLKSKLIEQGIFSEEEFIKDFREAAKRFEEQQREYFSNKYKSETPEGNADVSTAMSPSDIEVTVE